MLRLCVVFVLSRSRTTGVPQGPVVGPLAFYQTHDTLSLPFVSTGTSMIMLIQSIQDPVTLSKHSSVFASISCRTADARYFRNKRTSAPTQSLLSPSTNTVFITGLPRGDIITLAMHVFQPAALNSCASQASCGGSSWGSQQLTYKTSGRSGYIHHEV